MVTSEQIKEARAKLGLTQEELAHAIGVSVWTFTRWESGRTKKPSRLALKALERFLNGHHILMT